MGDRAGPESPCVAQPCYARAQERAARPERENPAVARCAQIRSVQAISLRAQRWTFHNSITMDLLCLRRIYDTLLDKCPAATLSANSSSLYSLRSSLCAITHTGSRSTKRYSDLACVQSCHVGRDLRHAGSVGGQRLRFLVAFGADCGPGWPRQTLLPAGVLR